MEAAEGRREKYSGHMPCMQGVCVWGGGAVRIWGLGVLGFGGSRIRASRSMTCLVGFGDEGAGV